MKLTRLFVSRPTLVFVLIALMSFAGLLSLSTLIQQLYPNVDQPTITISATYNGASVTEMRDNIVAPIEQNLAGTTDLQTINSVVQQGRASITAIYYLDSDVAADLVNTQKSVSAAQKALPLNLTPPTVSIRDPSESVVVTLALYSRSLTPGQLSLFADNVIAPKIQQIPGVAFANVAGDVTPAYEVRVNPMKLEARGLTLNDVITTVGNDNQRVPGGILYGADRETTIDVRGDIQTPSSIGQLRVVPSSGGGTTASSSGGVASLPGAVDSWTASNAIPRIADIATVTASNEPRRQYAQIDGKAGVFMQVQKTSDSSEVTASDSVLKALPLLRRQFPQVEFNVINVQSRFTRQQIESVTHTLLEGVLLCGIAMAFFLRSWRSAVVVCVSIPTSLAIALTAMKLSGLTLDTYSLLAMTLVIGILVDDSTVVLENIERHVTDLKEAPEVAAIKGRSEIGMAAIVITLVDVVVFVPIALIPGQVGRHLYEFGLVVVISTLTSLFVSFTVTPTLAGLWALKKEWHAPKIVDMFTDTFYGIREWYASRALPWALRHRPLVAGLCLVSFVGAVALVPLGVIGEEFIPSTDRGQLYIQMTYPLGTPLEHVRSGAYQVEQQVDAQKDLQGEATVVGGYSASFGGFVVQGNVAQIVIFLRDDRKNSTTYWVRRFKGISDKIAPDATNVVVPSTGQTAGNKQPIDWLVTDVQGGDPTLAAQKVLAVLKSTPGATSVNSTGTDLAPQMALQFNRSKAQALDVDIGSAATAAGAAFGGDQVTQFETPQGLEQVQVIYPLLYQHEFDSLKEMPIRAQNGSIVHLGDFATFENNPTSPLVTRTDRNTVIHVDANVAPGSSLSNVQAAFLKRLKTLELPKSIVVSPAPLGQQDFMNQTLNGIGHSLILSVILVFLLMVALYNSYRSPLIILFSVPVAAVGAMGALVLTHQTLNLYSLIGVVLLVGIATKNGILLVDYANTLRERGRDKLAAISESARTRFRPIVMTSISVVAGNIPLALALEPGSGNRISLGIVVIGGILSSLVLTLLLVPIAFLWIAPEDIRRKAIILPEDDMIAPHDFVGATTPG